MGHRTQLVDTRRGRRVMVVERGRGEGIKGGENLKAIGNLGFMGACMMEGSLSLL